jgi:hypothetical protein
MAGTWLLLSLLSRASAPPDAGAVVRSGPRAVRRDVQRYRNKSDADLIAERMRLAARVHEGLCAGVREFDPDDVHALADAQAELDRRGIRGARPFDPIPQAPPPPPGRSGPDVP